MQTLKLSTLKRVLCVGAHADDIEIGCGGTLLKLCRDHGGLDVMWVVFSAEGARDREARRSARSFLASGASKRIVVISAGLSTPSSTRQLADRLGGDAVSLLQERGI